MSVLCHRNLATSDIHSDVKQFENGSCDYCVVKITMQIGLNIYLYTSASLVCWPESV